MKTNLFQVFTRTLALLIVGGVMVFTISCKDDDDKVDCGKVTNEIIEFTEEWFEAVDNEDCEAIVSAYEKFFATLRKGKSCTFVKALLEDEEYSNVEEFIEALEAERDSLLDDFEC